MFNKNLCFFLILIVTISFSTSLQIKYVLLKKSSSNMEWNSSLQKTNSNNTIHKAQNEIKATSKKIDNGDGTR